MNVRDCVKGRLVGTMYVGVGFYVSFSFPPPPTPTPTRSFTYLPRYGLDMFVLWTVMVLLSISV